MSRGLKITSFQLISMVFFLVQSLIVGICIHSLLDTGRQTTWIAAILGSLLGFIPVLIFKYIFKRKGNKTLMELNTKIFGKIFGNIVNIILTLFAIISFMVSIWSIISFINIQFLLETPALILLLTFGIMVIIICLYEIESIARSMQIFLILISIVIISVMSGVSGTIEISNYLPVFETGLDNFIKTIIVYGIYTSFPLLLLLMITPEQINDEKKFSRSVTIGYIVGNLVNILALFMPLGIFGINLSLLYDCPNYSMMKKLNMWGFITRIENIMVIVKILPVIFFLILLLYFISRNLRFLFKVKKKKVVSHIVIISGLLMTVLSNNIFKNEIINDKWFSFAYPLIALIAFIVIPFIIYLRLITIKKPLDRSLKT